MLKGKTLSGILFVNIAVFTWATNMILGRYLRDTIGPVTLTAARFIAAAAVFVLFLKKLPPQERRIGKDFRFLAAMAATGVILFSPVLYLALRHTPAVNATIINGLGPLLTAVFAALILKERFTIGQTIGALLGFSGVLYLVSGGSITFIRDTGFNPGDLIVVAAVIIWALYSVSSSRTMRNRSSVSATALSIFMGLPVLILAAAVELMFIPVKISVQLVLIILYIGIIPAALGFTCWNAGVARLGAGGAMVFYNTMPLFGTLMGFLFLGEQIGSPHVIGGILIISGGVTAALNRKTD